jgi:hypothetical protein
MSETTEQTETTTRATGEIEVSRWEPTPYSEGGGPSLVAIIVEEAFHGDIEAAGEARMLQTLRADGSASFVGVERVSGTLAGKRGSWVFQDAGTLDSAGAVDGEWFVVPGSGTGGLSGLRGTGTFTAALGEHAAITLDYWFE